MDFIPLEIIRDVIFSFLDYKDLVVTSFVCKEWKEVNNEAEFVWKKLCSIYFRGLVEMPFSYEGASTTIFNGIKLSKNGIDSLSVKEMKSILKYQMVITLA